MKTAKNGLLEEISKTLNSCKGAFEVLSEDDLNVGNVACTFFSCDELYY